MHKNMLKILFLSLVISQVTLLADDCLEKSYSSANINKDDRSKDLDFSLCYLRNFGQCCCTYNIVSLFKDRTKDITRNRVNPAVDNLIKALRNQRLASDIKIEELVHLKYANALYSFYDKDGEKMKKKKLTMPKDDDDGCKDEIKFRKLKAEDKKRKGVYREGLLKEMLTMLHSLGKIDDIITEKNMIKVIK